MYIHPEYYIESRNKIDCRLFSNQTCPMFHFRKVFPGMYKISESFGPWKEETVTGKGKA